MKKALSLVLVLMLVLAMVPFGVFAELTKDGDVYLIGSAADLVEFKNMVNAAGANTRFDARLTADIDMSSVTDWTPIGNHKLDIGGTENDGYLGIFDGNGKTISNLKVTLTEGNWNGGSFNYSLLFGVLANGGGLNAEVKNFTLKDSSLTVENADDKEVFLGGISNNINRAKILDVTLDNVSITAKGAARGGAIGLVSQCGTWDPNLIQRVTVKGNCSINTESANIGCALVCARSFNDTLQIRDCVVDGKINAPEGARIAALCCWLNSGDRITNVENKTSYANVASDPEGAHEWAYRAGTLPELDGNVLNDKITDAAANDKVSGWGESNVSNLFDDNLFGTKYAGGFSGNADDPLVVTWKTTEATTVKAYAIVTGGDSAQYTDRNARTWKFYGSTDGETWKLLDDVADGGIAAYNDTAFVFTVDEPAAYTFYKWEVTATTGAFQHDSFILLDKAATAAKKIELKTGATVDGGTWTVDGNTYTLTETRERNHTGFNTYILGETTKAITLSLTMKAGVGDAFANDGGLMFGVGDANADGKIYEGNDYYYLVDFRGNKSVGVEKNNRSWGGWYVESAENSIAAAEDGTITVEVTYDPAAHTITVAQGEKVILSYTDYSAMPFTTTYYAIASKQTAGATYTVSEVLPPFEITKGAKTTVTEGSSKAVSITTANAEVTGVTVDGTALTDADYTVKNGVVTIKADFIKTLAVGDHAVVITAGDQTANATITVKESNNTGTGDSAAIVLVIVSVLALAGVAVASKKRAFQK